MQERGFLEKFNEINKNLTGNTRKGQGNALYYLKIVRYNKKTLLYNGK